MHLTSELLVNAQGGTWQQAVQWLPEVRVAQGMRLPLAASHDTYGISFARGAVPPDAAPEDKGAAGEDVVDGAGERGETLPAAAVSTGVPLQARQGRELRQFDVFRITCSPHCSTQCITRRLAVECCMLAS